MLRSAYCCDFPAECEPATLRLLAAPDAVTIEAAPEYPKRNSNQCPIRNDYRVPEAALQFFIRNITRRPPWLSGASPRRRFLRLRDLKAESP